MERQWIITSKNHQSRIDDFAYSQGINKTVLKDIKMNGDILVDGIHRTVRYLLNEGEVVTFIFPKENNQIPPENIPLCIVYEDDYLVVIDKQKGIPCIPTRAHPCHTLANALSHYYRQIHLDSTVHLVNRLDKDTAGLMIVAKYRIIHDMMCKNISHIYRKYRAHVEGVIDEQGIIDLPIHRFGYQMKREIHELGKPSRTHYYRITHDEKTSYVECILETGRTHQIRVHLSHIGHPLIGDEIYGHSNGYFDLTSIMVAFIHPVTKQIKVIKKEHY